MSWTRGDQETGSVDYQVREDRLLLWFRYQWDSGPWEHVEQVVSFDRTRCNCGGERIRFQDLVSISELLPADRRSLFGQRWLSVLVMKNRRIRFDEVRTEGKLLTSLLRRRSS
jgi:hypothetical protein